LPLWVMRVVAMSLGVTAGDFLSTTLQLGFGPSTFILVMVFFGLLAAQIIARRSSQMLSWSLVVCSTTAGTTMSDFLYSCVGSGGSLLLLMIAPSIGRFAVGPASADHNIAPRIQIFYWTTFLFLSAFGTNMGDFLVRDVGLGYAGGGLILCCAITLVVLAYCFTNLSPTRLFWVAFVLTRSLGMIVADTLTRTHAEGGLDVGTAGASVILAAVLTLLILLAGRGPEELNGWALISGAKNAAR
jgi:uncharacterized membrane-anchored protein